MQLPPVLGALQEDHNELCSIIRELEAPLEAEVRADLAVELVRYGSRYEDVKERAVFPLLSEHLDVHERERAEHDRAISREALSEVRGRIRHVKPINAHADDPIGFDRALDDLASSFRAELSRDADALYPAVERLDPATRAELKERADRATAGASEHPNPPHNPVGRAIINASEKVQRVVHDAATTSHLGVERLRTGRDA